MRLLIGPVLICLLGAPGPAAAAALDSAAEALPPGESEYLYLHDLHAHTLRLLGSAAFQALARHPLMQQVAPGTTPEMLRLVPMQLAFVQAFVPDEILLSWSPRAYAAFGALQELQVVAQHGLAIVELADAADAATWRVRIASAVSDLVERLGLPSLTLYLHFPVAASAGQCAQALVGGLDALREQGFTVEHQDGQASAIGTLGTLFTVAGLDELDLRHVLAGIGVADDLAAPELVALTTRLRDLPVRIAIEHRERGLRLRLGPPIDPDAARSGELAAATAEHEAERVLLWRGSPAAVATCFTAAIARIDAWQDSPLGAAARRIDREGLLSGTLAARPLVGPAASATTGLLALVDRLRWSWRSIGGQAPPPLDEHPLGRHLLADADLVLADSAAPLAVWLAGLVVQVEGGLASRSLMADGSDPAATLVQRWLHDPQWRALRDLLVVELPELLGPGVLLQGSLEHATGLRCAGRPLTLPGMALLLPCADIPKLLERCRSRLQPLLDDAAVLVAAELGCGRPTWQPGPGAEGLAAAFGLQGGVGWQPHLVDVGDGLLLLSSNLALSQALLDPDTARRVPGAGVCARYRVDAALLGACRTAAATALQGLLGGEAPAQTLGQVGRILLLGAQLLGSLEGEATTGDAGCSGALDLFPPGHAAGPVPPPAEPAGPVP